MAVKKKIPKELLCQICREEEPYPVAITHNGRLKWVCRKCWKTKGGRNENSGRRNSR